MKCLQQQLHSPQLLLFRHVAPTSRGHSKRSRTDCLLLAGFQKWIFLHSSYQHSHRGSLLGQVKQNRENCLPCTVAATSDTFVAAELLILKVQPPLNVNSFLSYTYSRRSHNFFFVVQVEKLSCWTRQRRRRTAGRGISPIYSNRYVQFVLARFGLSLPYALLLLQHH